MQTPGSCTPGSCRPPFDGSCRSPARQDPSNLTKTRKSSRVSRDTLARASGISYENVTRPSPVGSSRRERRFRSDSARYPPGTLPEPLGKGFPEGFGSTKQTRSMCFSRCSATGGPTDQYRGPTTCSGGGPQTRTRGRGIAPSPRRDPDQPGSSLRSFDLHRTQLRQQRLQLDITSSW